jgi:uncharacterized protein (DUF1501 family)
MCQHDHTTKPAQRLGEALEHGEQHSQDHARWSRKDFLMTGAMAAGFQFLLGNTPVKAFGSHPILSMLRTIETDRVLVLIQLNGGNDGLNTVIPISNDVYYQRRPTIAISKSNSLQLTPDIGLNPGLAALESMLDDGHMNILRNVGYPNPNLSHFRATDIWVSGSDSNVIETTGWMGRFLDMEYPNYGAKPPPVPVAVQIGTNQSLLFQGPANGMAMNISSTALFERLAAEGKAYDTSGLPDTTWGQEMAWVRNLANQSYTYAGAVQKASSKASNQANYPANNNLATNLAIVAKLIKGNLGAKVYMVSLGGFDTHANQLVNHENLLRNLGGAVKSFYDDLAFQGLKDKVTAMTFSEFGRRVSENGSNGTDHGTSAPMFLFGEGVNGGFTGSAPDLSNLDSSNNIRFETDYRQVYSTMMRDWFGIPADIAQEVFGAPFETLNLIQTPVSTRLGDDPTLPGTFTLRQNYPNPFNPSTVISYTLPRSERVLLRVFDVGGRLVRTLVDSDQYAGTYEVTFDAFDLASGIYLYTLETSGYRKSLKMTLVK